MSVRSWLSRRSSVFRWLCGHDLETREPKIVALKPRILLQAEERGWMCFNEQCFGWLREDRTLDALPMPRDWRRDMRGLQIEQSRREYFGIPYSAAVYSDDWHYPTRDEQHAVVRAYSEKRKSAA